MPTLSVKLPEETKQRIQSVAQSQGTTVHAVMVNAIESALSKAEHQNSLVAAALRAREQVVATGLVLDGRTFGDYLRAKTRGDKVQRPQPIGLKSLISAGK
jgi:predicted transcriptional regulator